MKKNDLVLGIDTSNYTTSIALTGAHGEILADLRKPLQVKQGERGLRQSHALFQHLENLPELLSQVLDSPFRERIAAVASSEKPRPVEGSYMPVFNAGVRFGTVVSKSLQRPFFLFSHQEGHLAAAISGTELTGGSSYLAWHLSGGTCELIRVQGGEIEIIGGSKDISFGQLIDRIGVSLKLAFPCGRKLDEMAQSGTAKGNPLRPIATEGLFFNVSGIETQAQRLLESLGALNPENLSFFLFSRMTECLTHVTQKAAAAELYGFQSSCGQVPVLFTGGVSASAFLRNALTDKLADTAAKPIFGAAALSSDNGVGISLLGGQTLWR